MLIPSIEVGGKRIGCCLPAPEGSELRWSHVALPGHSLTRSVSESNAVTGAVAPSQLQSAQQLLPSLQTRRRRLAGEQAHIELE